MSHNLPSLQLLRCGQADTPRSPEKSSTLAPAPPCRVKDQRGVRLFVEGSIKSADGSAVYATCDATLADMTQFMD